MKAFGSFIHTYAKPLLFVILSFPFFTLNALAAGCNVGTFSSLLPPGDSTNVVITSATVVPAATVPLIGVPGNAINLPSYCSVIGSMDTASTSVINFEIRLPSPWNGKFYMNGNGGFAGSISTAFNSTSNSGPIPTIALSRGYTTSATDTGHVGSGNPTWALNNSLGQINYGYRAVHLTALITKEAIVAYYGQPAQFSYFNSCSNGGRQALMEAQRYPTDFNGIIAGGPALNTTDFRVKITAIGQAQYPDGNFLNPVLPLSKLNLLTSSVLAKCDNQDGIKDGIINDPNKCHFRPDKDLPRCKNNIDSSYCFTSQQINVLNTIYDVTKAANKISAPGYVPGAEDSLNGVNNWTAYIFGTPSATSPFTTPAHPSGVPQFGIFFAEGTHDNFITFTNLTQPVSYLDTDISNQQTITAIQSLAPIIDAVDPDLTQYKNNGGKLIIYHGWNDPAVSPYAIIDYYKEVTKTMNGKKNTADFARLFMVPGMLHCYANLGAGPGPNTFNMLDSLENWVENGNAPDSVIATNPVTGMSRPLCPYPEIAVLNDGLDATNPIITNNATNFHCSKEKDN